MRFLTLDQIRAEPFQTEYRYPVATTLIVFFVLICLSITSAVVAWKAWREAAWIGVVLLGWLTFWLGFFASFAKMVLRARLQPTNWLVRTQMNAVLVKFRSYLNFEFDPTDAVIIHIDYSEIEFARQFRLRQNIPGYDAGDDEMKFNRYAEFKIRDLSRLTELESRLAEERNRSAAIRGRFIKGRTKSGHYPVTVSAGGFLRIEWNVRPKLAKFMEEISGQVQIDERVTGSLDFRALQTASPKEQEDAVLSLIATGDRIAAVKVVRLLYRYDMARAVRFVDELSSRELRQ